MTQRTIALLVFAVLACLATASSSVSALDYDLRSPMFERSQRSGRAAAPRQTRAAPAPQRPAPSRGFFETLFGGGGEAARAAPAANPSYVHQPYYRPAQPYGSRLQSADERGHLRRGRQASPRQDGKRPNRAVARDVVKPKVNPSTFIAVFGDSLGQGLAQGLDQALADNPDVVVTPRANGDASLAKLEPYDLLKAAREVVAGPDKTTIAVIMVGSGDRQPIKDGDTMVEPGSDRWGQIYGGRVTDLIRTFADKKIPVIWVGQPPMKDDKLAADMVAMNTLDRGVVERAGGVFVDVWEPFVDADNRYSAYGPDVSGEKVKLRANDGVHFTRAGERKLAHFVNVEIKRILDARAVAAATPADAKEVVDPAELIDRQMTALPEPPGSVGLATKPIAGPVLPLTQIEETPGGVLLASAPRKAGDATALIDRVFGQGLAVDPQPGRADDFRWPRQGS